MKNLYQLSNDNDYIFFLMTSKKLSSQYIILSNFFAQHHISLIPITITDFKLLLHESNNIHVIAMVNTLESREIFDGQVKNFLNFLIKQKKIHFYHISSFRPLAELGFLSKNGSYQFYPLPVDATLVCDDVSTRYFAQMRQTTKWPGGRRAKLPIEL